MKRQIKFRGKTITTNEWVYGYFYVKEDIAYIYNKKPYEAIPETVGQYVGLLDKQNKEIFEGDIIKIEGDKAMIVGWSNKFASFVLNRDGWAFSHWFGESCNPIDCEIVGNIYENKGLLK